MKYLWLIHNLWMWWRHPDSDEAKWMDHVVGCRDCQKGKYCANGGRYLAHLAGWERTEEPPE